MKPIDFLFDKILLLDDYIDYTQYHITFDKINDKKYIIEYLPYDVNNPQQKASFIQYYIPRYLLGITPPQVTISPGDNSITVTAFGSKIFTSGLLITLSNNPADYLWYDNQLNQIHTGDTIVVDTSLYNSTNGIIYVTATDGFRQSEPVLVDLTPYKDLFPQGEICAPTYTRPISLFDTVPTRNDLENENAVITIHPYDTFTTVVYSKALGFLFVTGEIDVPPYVRTDIPYIISSAIPASDTLSGLRWMAEPTSELYQDYFIYRMAVYDVNVTGFTAKCSWTSTWDEISFGVAVDTFDVETNAIHKTYTLSNATYSDKILFVGDGKIYGTTNGYLWISDPIDINNIPSTINVKQYNIYINSFSFYLYSTVYKTGTGEITVVTDSDILYISDNVFKRVSLDGITFDPQSTFVIFWNDYWFISNGTDFLTTFNNLMYQDIGVIQAFTYDGDKLLVKVEHPVTGLTQILEFDTINNIYPPGHTSFTTTETVYDLNSVLTGTKSYTVNYLEDREILTKTNDIIIRNIGV